MINIRHRRTLNAELDQLGVARSRVAVTDLALEALLTVARTPLRSVLTSLGTVLAIATAVATIGVGESGAEAVSATFNALRVTMVTFTASANGSGPPPLTEASERALDRLNGVRCAGLAWTVGSGQLFDVSRVSPVVVGGPAPVALPITAATPGGLAAMSAHISLGEAYDSGMEHRHENVALLGIRAAQQLGLTSIALSPVIYINGAPLSVIGIISSAPADTDALLSVVVPPAMAAEVTGVRSGSQILVRTAPGAAQLIGEQGPAAIDPLDPSAITAEVPPDPTLLHHQVSSSVTTLLLVIAIIALLVGVIAIANTTLLSVIQRRGEIGLRRSVGAAPGHIAAMIIAEAAIVGAIGAIIGASTGVLATAGIAAAKGWLPVLDPRVIGIAPLAGTVAGAVAGMYPAWRASHVSPIEALQR